MRGLVVLACLLCAANPAQAHHDATVGRIDPPTGLLSSGIDRDAPQIETSLGYRFGAFDRLRDGTETVESTASITTHVGVVGTTLYTEQGFAFRALLPFGWSASRQEDEETSTVGLGDLVLGVARGISSGALRFELELGAVVPTGRYDPDNTVSVVDLVTEDAQLDLATFDTRASLGANAWSGRAEVRASWNGSLLTPNMSVGTVVPLTETSDQIRWGADVVTRAGLSLIRDRVSVAASGEWRHHQRDRLELVVGDLPPERTRVGGRDELAIAVEAAVGLGDDLSCGIGLHVPMWQRTGAPQLVERFSGSLQCAMAIGL